MSDATAPLEGQMDLTASGQADKIVAGAPAIQQVRAVWQSSFWGNKVGHEEVMDLTDLVARVTKENKLILFDLQSGDRVHPKVEPLQRARRALRPRVRPGQD